MTDSPTQFQTQKWSCPRVDLTTAPCVLGLATRTIRQKIKEDSCTLMPHVTGLLILVPIVDHETALRFSSILSQLLSKSSCDCIETQRKMCQSEFLVQACQCQSHRWPWNSTENQLQSLLPSLWEQSCLHRDPNMCWAESLGQAGQPQSHSSP